MSFSITTQQMYDEIKTCTRRLGWDFLKPGDYVMAVEKGMGLKKGEKIKRIYPIMIDSNYPEPLTAISQLEVIREGFPDWDRDQFIEMFCKHNKCTPETVVNRIAFRKAVVSVYS